MNPFDRLANPWVRHLASYEPGKPIEEVARELGFSSVEGIAKLASNENPLGPSPRALDAMRKAAAEMHRYPDGSAFYLTRAVAKALAVDERSLVFGAGSNELIELLAHVFLGPGLSIVMADRAFVVYRLVAAAQNAGTIAVPMRDGFTHDLAAMAEAVTPKTRLVFIANPNNPTGTAVSPAEIEAFLKRVPDHVITVFDEAYVELLDESERPESLRYVREGRPVVVLRTFSKVYGLAGLRIGYAVAPPPCAALLHRVRQPFNVNAMALAAAEAALEDHAHVERTRRVVREGLAFFERELKALGIPFVPSKANFLLVRTGRGREVFQALQAEKVIVRPMDGYGLPDYVRITIGTPEENQQCLEALKKVLSRGVGA